MTSQLVTNTILAALKQNKKPVYLHTDMGSQYTGFLFENFLKGHGIKHSYSLKEHPYDNGPI